MFTVEERECVREHVLGMAAADSRVFAAALGPSEDPAATSRCSLRRVPIFVHTTDGRTYTAVVDDQVGEDETLTRLLEQTGDFARGWIRVHDQRGHDGYVPYAAVVRVAQGDEPTPLLGG